MSTISVLVVNFNGRHFLSECLTSLEQQTRPADEIILVDNASSDESVEYVRRCFPRVTVIALATNAGFSEGNNIAMRAAQGEYLALLNTDAVAAPSWLCELNAVLEHDPSVGAVVPKIYRSDSARIEQVGAEFNNLANIWGRGFNELDQGQYDATTEVAALTACAAVVRRRALGGDMLFDRSFFMYHEELDLSIRLRGRGYSIVYVPTAVIRHRGMESTKTAWKRPRLSQQFYCNRNRMKILAKYYPATELLRSAPLILLGLAYWNAAFLFRDGVGLFLRAVLSQTRFTARGFAERHTVHDLDRARWLTWMRRQGLGEIRRVKAAHDNAASHDAAS